MKQEYSLNASPVQFFELADQIHNELSNIGRDVITIHKPAFLLLFAVGSEGSWTPDRRQELANYDGDTEIFICAESRALRDKGITVIVKDWDGEISKLAIEYRDNDDWELAKDTWTIFEERIKQNGWQLSRKSTAAFAPAIVHDARHLFEDSRGDSRREKIEAMKLLHGLGDDKPSTMPQAKIKKSNLGKTSEREVEMSKRTMLRKATKKEGENLDTYKLVLDIFDKVCKRLGYTYRILHQASDASRVEFAIARAYDNLQVLLMQEHTGAPDLILDWHNAWGEVEIRDHRTDRELIKEFHNELWQVGLLHAGTGGETMLTFDARRAQKYLELQHTSANVQTPQLSAASAASEGYSTDEAQAMGLLKFRPSAKGKGVELYQEIHQSIAVLDAAITRTFSQLGYFVDDARQLDADAILESVSPVQYRIPIQVGRQVLGTVVREQRTLGRMCYHYLDKDTSRGLGILQLHKKSESLTECYLSPPPRYMDYSEADYKEKMRQHLRLTSTLIQELAKNDFWKIQDDTIQVSKAPVLTLQRVQKKQVKRALRRFKDGLNCNANAADVVAVLFGGVGIRKMEITGAQCLGEFELHCATSLSINTSLDSDYVVFISLTMREIESMETGREELLYLLWDSEVAEIKIKQEQAGHCRMELYIDENESQWMDSRFQMPKDIPMEQDQDAYINKTTGLPLIDECWKILKEEWIRHESAQNNQNAPTPTEQNTSKNIPSQWQEGTPPKTQADKRRLVERWDAIPRDERPPLADWLIERCGTDPATEIPNVNEQTFHGWRRYLRNS